MSVCRASVAQGTGPAFLWFCLDLCISLAAVCGVVSRLPFVPFHLIITSGSKM